MGEITGKVIKILESRSGTKKDGGTWVKHFFVVETSEQYPKKIVFSVFGDEKWSKMGIVEGASYAVSFDIDANEWKGNWYNDISAWKAIRVDGGAQPQPQSKPKPQPKPQAPAASGAKEDNTDSIPF